MQGNVHTFFLCLFDYLISSSLRFNTFKSEHINLLQYVISSFYVQIQGGLKSLTNLHRQGSDNTIDLAVVLKLKNRNIPIST